MRLPYAPSSPPKDSSQETQQIYDAVARRRAPRPLLPLDLALLHSPPVANGWNEFLGALRTKTTISQAILELAVCRIAVLNKAGFEWRAHAPLAMKAGVKREVLKYILEDNWRAGQGEVLLDEVQKLVVEYTDQMTKFVKVEEKVSEQLKTHFNDREVVELTAAIAGYNCVSRFLVALDVGEQNGQELVLPTEQ